MASFQQPETTPRPVGQAEADFSVQDIVEADLSLMDRQGDGLAVTLWLVKATSQMYVTVEDTRALAEDGATPVLHRLDVEKGENPLDKESGKYWHPFVFIAD